MRQTFAQSSLYRLLTWFVTPRLAVDDNDERRRFSLILAFLALLCVLSSVSVMLLISFGNFNPVMFLILALYFALFAFARFVSPDWAIRLVIAVILGLPYLAVAVQPQSFEIFSLLFLALLALVIASVFTRFRTTLVVTVFALAMVFSINLIVSPTTPLASLRILIPSLVISSLLLLNAYYKEPRSKPNLTMAYDYHPEAVLIQLENRIIYANAATARLLEIEKPEELIGKMVNEYLPISSSHYHVKNEDGRFTLSYEEALPGQEKRLHIKTTTIPYGKHLATLLLLKPVEESAAENEEKSFRTLSGLMSDYAYSLEVSADETLKFLWVAGAIRSMIGKSDEEVMALPGWESVVHPDDLAFFKLRQSALLGGEARGLEYRILRPDGTVCWVQDNATPLRDKQTGRVNRILGEAHDISERIEAQEVLRTHVVQQAVVAELGLLALSMEDPMHLLSHATVLCEQVLEAQLCVIFEHDTERFEMVCRSSSRPESFLPVGRRISTSPQSSLLAYTLFSQEAIVSEDLSRESRFRPLPELLEQQFHSAMSVIILGQSSPYGVMSVYSQKKQVFDNDEIYFLQSVANVLGTFIERHRAQAAEREQREFAEALRDATAVINSRLELHDVLSKILAYLPQVVPSMETSSIMLYEDEERLYHFVSTWGYGEEINSIIQAQLYPRERFPLLERVIETRQPLIIPNIPHEPLWFRTNDIEVVNAYLGAPIIVQGNFIGILHLNSSKTNAFSAKDAERVQTFADKTGTAITNARRADELERLVKIRTEELHKQREQLAAILNSTGEGIFYVEDGKIVFANPRLCEMTAYTLEELVGRDSHIFFPSDLNEEERQRVDAMESSIRAGKVARLEMRFMKQDRQLFEVGITSSALQSPDGILRKVSLIRDISQEKELANLKNRFVAHVAHDLRSPITSLKMRMYMIEKHPEQLRDHLEKLEQIINRMNRLVGDLLDSSTIGQGTVTVRPESMILQTILQRVVEILLPEAEEAKLQLALDMPEAPIHVWADSVRLEQVFTNLITNAIHYTPGGSIRVVCEKVAREAQIRVIDTGAGIPPESLEMIFLPFYRLSQNAHIKGTGLGLSISRDIIEKHGGKIEVSSELGKGSCFTIHLPLLDE